MNRSSSPIERIAERLGIPGLLDRLTDSLSPSDLNTLLLELFRRKTRRSSPGDLLKRYDANRFVQPAGADPIALRRLELDCLELAARYDYLPVELSPVTPLGTCSLVASADQNKVLSALRGTEVVADATNTLALHISSLLKSGRIDNREAFVRFSAVHRHVRTQFWNNAAGMLPHFPLFAMVTSGKDKGSCSFETEAFQEHIDLYRELFQALGADHFQIVLIPRGGYKESDGLMPKLIASQEGRPYDLSVREDPEPNSYYRGIQFKVEVRLHGEVLTIGDGGLVDWSQQLLSNRKERMLISGIGLEPLIPKPPA
ncbi:hypothetical protein MJA45_22535 [Paenibacillus aurantius]|uniref:Uncharacterized protein n=1 Tax=Paenibacillus aurantius TaxID=2918900 RepID=A0AA96LB49_9BACL|nr:hypothetical protein [Paenibacillus aurantius]WNQ10372.1 hypothetical protein MJA45_22535 [Paenibacillus aurantius]